MHKLYIEKYEPQVKETGAKPEVKEWLYRKIFNEEFNLSFGYPGAILVRHATCYMYQYRLLSLRKRVQNCKLSLLHTKRRQAKGIAFYVWIQKLQRPQETTPYSLLISRKTYPYQPSHVVQCSIVGIQLRHP